MLIRAQVTNDFASRGVSEGTPRRADAKAVRPQFVPAKPGRISPVWFSDDLLSAAGQAVAIAKSPVRFVHLSLGALQGVLNLAEIFSAPVHFLLSSSDL